MSEEVNQEKILAEPEETKLNLFIDYSAPEICRRVAEQLEFVNEGSIFIIFGMGSIRLSIDNPDNFLSINRDYIEVYNDVNEELTFIKIEELTGFVLEPPKQICDCEDNCTCEMYW